MKKTVKNKIILKNGKFCSDDICKLKEEYGIRKTAILIRCSMCAIQHFLIIPNKIIEDCKNLAKLVIPQDIICKHTLIVYVDKNYDVRGCVVADYEMTLNSLFRTPED